MEKIIVIEVDGKRISWNVEGLTDLAKVCAPFGKNCADYLSDPQTQSYIGALARSYDALETLIYRNRAAFSRATEAPLAIVLRVGREVLVPPEVVLHCSAWIDPAFQVAYLQMFRKTHPDWLEQFPGMMTPEAQHPARF